MLEGVHSFGQRYLIMGYLWLCNDNVYIEIRNVTPQEYLERALDRNTGTMRIIQKVAIASREQLKRLIQAMISFSNRQELAKFRLMPSNKSREYSCISWSLRMLVECGILPPHEIEDYSWLPSREVGNGGWGCMLM